MMKRVRGIAFGGPTREQAREVVPGDARRARRARRLEVRDASAARQPSGELCACVLAEPRRELRRCLRGGVEGLADKRGTDTRAREVRAARAAGRWTAQRSTYLPSPPVQNRKRRQNVEIPRFLLHAKSCEKACRGRDFACRIIDLPCRGAGRRGGY